MHRHFETQQTLPYTVERVFAFFANPENLPRLMPPWQKARIEEAVFAPPPPPPAGMRLARGAVIAGDGTRLTLSFRAIPLLPLRFPWDARIEDFRWNQGFCDVQERGPFASWRHCHSITPADLDDTPAAVITDRVEYALPLDSISNIADRLVIRPQLRRTFDYRHRRTMQLLALSGG